MLKKIMTLCICLVMLYCCAGTVCAYSDVTDDNNVEAINFLSAHGILNGYEDGEFKPSKNVTRAEFVTMIMKIQNLGSVGADDMTYYSDVTKDYWALADINMATSSRLISGYEDGTFRPEESITVTDTAKILVCLLGYRDFAEGSGGYPDGYTKIAVDNGIFNNIKTQYGKYATRDDVALMLYNALEANIAEWDGSGYSITDKNLLNAKLKVFKRTGVITATKYAEIVPARTLFDDEIAIDNVIYKITDKFMHELVGYCVDFYVKDEDGQLVITYYSVDENENQSMLIQREDINYEDCTVSEFSYYDENDKSRTVKLDTDYVTKNGVSVYLVDKSVFDITDGNVLLIDTDEDGEYENIFINSVKNIIVGRINKKDKIITDEFLSSKKLELSDDDKTVTIRYNDEEIKFEDIIEGDIITYTESDERVVAYVSRSVVSGLIETVHNEGNSMTLVMDDENEYKMSSECFLELEKTAGKKKAIVPDMRVKLYLNVYNEIAQIELEGVDNEKYAFLVSAYYDIVADEAILTIWPEDGSVQKFVVDDRINLKDGTSGKKVTPEELVQKLAETRITDTDAYINNPYFQIIKFSLDDEEKIKLIRTAMSSEDGSPLRIDGVFTRDFLTDSAATTNKKDIINGAYKFSENVKIFNIPPEHNAYSEYSNTASFPRNLNGIVAIYDMNEGNLFDAILIINPSYDSYLDDSEYKPLFTYDHTTTVWDDSKDDEIAYDAYGVYNKVVRSFRFSKAPAFNKRDVYQAFIVNDKIVKYSKIYDAKTESFAAGSADSEGLGIKGSVSSEVVLGVMRVKSINSDSIVVTDAAGKELLLCLTAATRYTLNTEDEIRKADISEIEVDNKVAFRTYEGTAGDLVIIR